MAGMTYDELRSSLSGLDEYQPEDEATLRQRIQNIYEPGYQQSLQQLRESLATSMARQQRNAVKTGMQRSSYHDAQNAILQGSAMKGEAQLASDYNSNVAGRLLDLLEGEKNRKTAADQYRNNLLMQLYNMQPKSSGTPGQTQPKITLLDLIKDRLKTTGSTTVQSTDTGSDPLDLSGQQAGIMGGGNTTTANLKAFRNILYPLQTVHGAMGITDANRKIGKLTTNNR